MVQLRAAVRRKGVRVLVVTSLIGLPAPVAAQFSPGPLSRAHADIDKTAKCFQCHEPRKATTADRCLACHVELRQRIDTGKGFHGRMQAASRARCGSCHIEHGGRDVELIRWDGGRERFDHRQTGFALEGAHAALACNTCHTPKWIRATDVLEKRSVNLGRTYLGLRTTCHDCHTDVHHGQFEARMAQGTCSVCHGQSTWKPVAFDHEASRYPLRGKHRQVQCQKCHGLQNEGGEPVAAGTPGAFARYRPLAFDSCKDCHRDPHQDRYGANCTRCHSVEAWTLVSQGAFDHDRTDFPLRGRHAGVACNACHKSGFKQPIAFARCTDCHRDAHQGQLAHRSDKGECSACHDVQGFAPARFAVREHAATRFELDAAHRAVACNRCHTPLHAGAPPGAVRFRFDRLDCQACHADPHLAQFADATGRTECTRCHVRAEWRIARFDHDRLSRFPLQGAHARTKCSACHPGEVRDKHKVVRYKPVDVACRSCHAEPVERSKLDEGR
jgi:hypothetical protein